MNGLLTTKVAGTTIADFSGLWILTISIFSNPIQVSVFPSLNQQWEGLCTTSKSRGTILVSVLEIMGLPLSSSTCIKVSMGKTEYLVSEKGDFSFPLTSLRDDFIIKLQDADGNEISRIGFQTKSIVEKGVWDEVFSLGDGHLHLKLQFILNDEERDRIRIMRQAALKKKHDELLNSSPRCAESGSTFAGNTAVTFSTNDEVSESPNKYIQLEADSQVKSPIGFQNDKQSGTKKVGGAKPDQMQLNSNSADQYKETSSNKLTSQAVDLTKLKENGLIKMPAFHSPSVKDPQRVINSEEVAILFKSSEQKDFAMNNLIQSNPSSVRKMISTFERESGVAQDMRSHIKPPPTDYQSNKIETKPFSKTQHAGEEKAWNNFKVVHKSDKEEKQSNKDLMRTSAFETVTISGKILEKHSESNHPSSVFSSRQDSRNNPGKEEKRGENAFKGSGESCIQRDSPHTLNSMVQFDDNDCSFESSGAWIFPDEPRKLCVTTGGKNVMHLLESLVSKRISHQRSLDSSRLENMEKNAAYIGTQTEVSKHEKTNETEESESKNSDANGDEISGGPIKQVVKVAIIMGFALLVLLTRQRKGR